jgi:hypothetical protein
MAVEGANEGDRSIFSHTNPTDKYANRRKYTPGKYYQNKSPVHVMPQSNEQEGEPGKSVDCSTAQKTARPQNIFVELMKETEQEGDRQYYRTTETSIRMPLLKGENQQGDRDYFWTTEISGTNGIERHTIHVMIARDAK